MADSPREFCVSAAFGIVIVHGAVDDFVEFFRCHAEVKRFLSDGCDVYVTLLLSLLLLLFSLLVSRL